MNALGQSLLATLQGSGNLRAFLRMIREGESSQTEAAYRTVVGGGQVSDLTDHPRQRVYVEPLKVWSTAAGAYQFLERTWDGCAKALGLTDFGQPSQDAAAVYLIRGRKALDDVLAGRVQQAISKCAREWASLPGSPYGQPVMTMQRALDVYRSWGGTDRPDGAAAAIESREVPPTPKEVGMSPFIKAALPSLVELLPKLGRIFSSGSQTAERNVAAAEVVAETVIAATGARNIQEAVEAVRADPALRQAAEQAIDARWYELTEAGGGGIDGARKADQAAMAAGGPWWAIARSPSFVVALLLLPLVYLIVLSVIGVVGSASWSDDVRAAIAGTIVGSIVGGLVGYYYGQTTSRNRGPIGAQQ